MATATEPAPRRERHSIPGDATTVKTSEAPKLHLWQRLKELWGYREILVNLTRKEVKVKYTSSVLGVAWSLLNPIMYLVVFTVVFQKVLRSGIPDFAIYLLSGLLAWNLFAGSLSLSTRSIVENANLVKKVYFPREILPFASIGASLVDFGLQILVLAAFLGIEQHNPAGVNLALLPIAVFALLLFTAALSLWVGALNVRYRDTQHLLNLALLTWFWFTPIVYPSGWLMLRAAHNTFLGVKLSTLYLALNPMGVIIMGFQRALYADVNCPAVIDLDHPCTLYNASVGNEALMLAGVVIGSIVLLYVFLRYFFKQAGDFAEEL
jgi:ABC-2 type transport system permease protein